MTSSPRKNFITPYGNAQISTAQSKFGGSSALFDGTGDYLAVLDSTDWTFGSGNFTIECWVRFDTLAGDRTIITQYNSSANRWYFEWHPTLGLGFACEGDPATFSKYQGSTSGWSVDTWYHIAVVRNGNTITIYRAGTSIASQDCTGLSISDYAGSVYIGQRGTDQQYFDGYIDELRLSKGIARWTGNFTPDTSPYTSDSYTKLLLHFDGANASTRFIDDAMPLNAEDFEYWTDRGGLYVPRHQVYTVADAQVDIAQKKFGSGSALFDGTGDYLSVPAHSDWNFGSGAWTIDFWLYLPAVQHNVGFCGFAYTGTSTISIWTVTTGGGDWVPDIYDDASNRYCWQGGSPPATAWTHVALVRSGSTVYFFVDGVQQTTFDVGANTFNCSAKAFLIGSARTSDYYAACSIDELRISNAARWTSGFTPSTAPYTADANTLLLMHMDGIDGSTVFPDSSQSIDQNLNIGRNATTNLPTYKTNQVNTIAAATLSADYIGMSKYALSQPATIFAVTKPAATITGTATLVGTGHNTTTTWGVGVEGTGRPYTAFGTTLSGTKDVRGDYHVLTYTLSGGTSNIRIDGYQDAAGDVGVGGYNGLILGVNGASGAYYDGDIAEMAVYSRALTGTELTNTEVYFGNKYNIGIIDPYTVFLCHCDGADSGTTFTDVASGGLAPHAITPNGDAHTHAAEKKFGSASCALDGTGDYLSCANSADFDLGAAGAGNFTMEGWFNFSSTSSDRGLISCQQKGSANGWQTYYSGGTIHVWTGSGTDRTISWTPSTGVWYHIAIVRNSTTITVYVDGISKGTVADGDFSSDGSGFAIGAYNDGGDGPFSGYIDEVRITKGLARYTGNFTSQAHPFSQYYNPLNFNYDTIDQYKEGLAHVYTLNETAGNRLDNVGGKTLTDQGSTSYITGKNGNVADFNGSSQALYISEQLFIGTNDFLVSMWVRTPDPLADGYVIMCYNTSSENLTFGVQVYTSKFYCALRDTALREITGTTSLAAGTWYKVGVGRSANTMYLYVNGVSEGTPVAVATQDTTNNFVIAARNYGSGLGSWYKCSMDELDIWENAGWTNSTALSAHELALYNSGTGRFSRRSRYN